jgi:hypothetical protein
MIISLGLLVELVKTGLTGWAAIKGAVQSSKMTVEGPTGQMLSLAELESRILAAEDAAKATSQHAHDRIDQRHQGDQ